MEPVSGDLASLARELRLALSAHPEVRLAILFGSWTRGRATPASDVDLAVQGYGIDRLELAVKLGQRLGREVDVVPLEGAHIPMLRQIVRYGIVVHEGAPGAAAIWRSRALSELEIDGPWYERMRDAWLARVAHTGLGDGRR